jgi:diguanylate cyclase (GGDEF)-like protein/PAS domain S-box-containing protein
VLDALQSLAIIATRTAPTSHDIDEACGVIREALGAADAYVIRAGDPHFIRLGCDCPPETYEIKQKGYWITWRQLAAQPELIAAGFDVQDRIASNGGPMYTHGACTHIATILPGDESNSELLVVHGPWPGGLTEDQRHFIAAARPILAHTVSNVLDASRRSRQREQLDALANVSKAFSEAHDAEDVITSIATALAKASGYDWVTISVFNDTCDEIVERTMNLARHSDTQTASRYRGVSAQNAGEMLLAVELAKRNACILLPDVFDPALLEREDEVALMRPDLPGLQRYWERAHILSVAMFPIVFQERPLGFVAFSSSTARALDAQEAEFLRALVSQAATTIKGVRLYADLEASRSELRQREEHFRSLVQNGSDLITVMDADGILRYASPAVERIMGYAPGDWIGRGILSMVHPDDISRAVASLAAVIEQPGVHPPTTVRIRHADGTWRYIETRANNLLDVPAVAGIVHNSDDVTERWHAEAALRESEERFRSLVQHGSDLITVIEADTTIRYQSPSVTRILGYDPEALVGTKLAALMHAEDVAGMVAVLNDIVNKADGIAVAEGRLRHVEGSWRDVEIIATDQRHNHAIGGFVLNVRDVTERKVLERQLRHQALHDPLTKLANRTRFADRLEHALLRAGRTRQSVAVLFMDLDNFKAVNDSLGHAAGDALLTAVAERVQGCLRPGDTVARLGGDEFAILLEDVTSTDDATAVTDRVFESLDATFTLEGKDLCVRASVSLPRMRWSMTDVSWRRSSSPAACPQVSFTALKLSRSMNMSACSRSWVFAVSMSSVRRRSNSRRFTRPVSAS